MNQVSVVELSSYSDLSVNDVGNRHTISPVCCPDRFPELSITQGLMLTPDVYPGNSDARIASGIGRSLSRYDSVCMAASLA